MPRTSTIVRNRITLVLSLAISAIGCSAGGSSAKPDGGVDPGNCVTCGEACVDTRSDSANCGACGVACGAAESCQSGACKPRPGTFGAACVKDADCAAGLCLSSGLCSKACVDATGCPPKPEWTCAAHAGTSTVCQCAASGPDIPDGRDNDCDGKVDNPAPGTATPPPPPAGKGTTSGTTRWFVVNQFRLGITRKGSSPPIRDANAWKDYGYDLDARVTSADDSRNGYYTCKRVAGSPSGILTDGNGGRDNAFAGHVTQVISQLKADIEDATNAAVASGGTTLLLRLDNVGPDDNPHVPGALYAAVPLATGQSPKFDGSDVYAVLHSTLSDGATLASPTASFPGGYMAGGVWVSGVPSYAVAMTMPLGFLDALPVASPLVSVRVSDGTDGTIAGAFRTTALQTSMASWLRQFAICPSSSTYQQVITTMLQSADVVFDAPSLQDPTATCNALSMGIGFTLRPVQEPTQAVDPPAAGKDPCAGP